ncbi:hypothetical protein [Consotaella aegiceratis]|uniref:hypothetical protein n=1 Tax=Consotaella aegiceratis TaxID=3097961 RepID=UPI002F404D9E
MFGKSRQKQTGDFPEEFDSNFYRSKYPRLSGMDDATLRKHYSLHGRTEGRQASPAALRSGFIPLFEHIRPILEIGPFDRPMVEGDKVSYFDVLGQEDLQKKAIANNRGGTVPYIEFVSEIGDLSIVDRKFNAVCSAHCIEHQVDLIAHLDNVAKVLEGGGYYFIAAPDKRYSFDHFIPESTVADIIDAHKEPRKTHSLANIIKHVALATHNDAPRHWEGIHADPGYEQEIGGKIKAALNLFDKANGRYIDAHAWRFSPSTFRNLMEILSSIDLIPFDIVRVYETPKPRVEFMAILRKKMEE